MPIIISTMDFKDAYRNIQRQKAPVFAYVVEEFVVIAVVLPEVHEIKKTR